MWLFQQVTALTCERRAHGSEPANLLPCNAAVRLQARTRRSCSGNKAEVRHGQDH
jgi:hypothetical protein